MVDFFTRESGRLTGIARGARQAKKGPRFETFQLGQLDAIGSGLMTVTQFEVAERPGLSGDGLAAGYYLLELIQRGLGELQQEAKLFDTTVTTLRQLAAGANLRHSLRNFELTYLQELGYGIDVPSDIDPLAHYVYEVGEGFHLTSHSKQAIAGSDLLKLRHDPLQDAATRRLVKTLVQKTLPHVIGQRPMVSRSLLSAAVKE